MRIDVVQDTGPCAGDLVVSVSASHMVGSRFSRQAGYTTDHQKWYKLPPSFA